jgi:DNA-binding transcriptional ArsR family regulator
MTSRATETAARAKLLAKLEDATERRKKAEADLERERRATDKLLSDGERLGVPIAHLAEAAGLSRPTVYGVLRDRSAS